MTFGQLNVFGQFWQLELTVILVRVTSVGSCAAFERQFTNLMQQHSQNSFMKCRWKCKKSTDWKDRKLLQVGKLRTANTLVVVQFVVRENTSLYFIFVSCALCVKVACKLNLSNSSQIELSARHGFLSRFFADARAFMKKKVQIGVKFGDFFSHRNQIMPTVGWLIYFGTPLISLVRMFE